MLFWPVGRNGFGFCLTHCLDLRNQRSIPPRQNCLPAYLGSDSPGKKLGLNADNTILRINLAWVKAYVSELVHGTAVKSVRELA